MLYASQLLSLAEQLAESPPRGAPKQVRLRRPISTAYYAVVHRLVSGAADILVGAGQLRNSQRYLLVYRSFEHRRMADVCRQVMGGSLRTESGAPFEAAIRQCAAAFIELQEGRHEADYDPIIKIALSDAKTAVAKAPTAIQRLENSPEPERMLFLTLLHFKFRP